MANLLAVKPLSKLLTEAENEGRKRTETYAGPAEPDHVGHRGNYWGGNICADRAGSSDHAGPAVVLSFVLAGWAARLRGFAMRSLLR